MPSELHARPLESQHPGRHPAPRLGAQITYEYEPAKEGLESNLMIMLHGLGDTMQPFAKLGKSLNLPQTSVLSLQAPLRVPLLDEDAFMWYPSFDNLGELVASPDPTLAVELVCKVLDHLTGPCKWPATSIHLFGFAQGGSIAAHAALEYAQPLASVISISGPLLSYQTGARDKRTSPPSILLVRRMGEERSVQVNNFRRAFEDVKEVVLRTGQGMPRERSEWEDIMRFWATKLHRRSPLELGDDVYELTGGKVI